MLTIHFIVDGLTALYQYPPELSVHTGVMVSLGALYSVAAIAILSARH